MGKHFSSMLLVLILVSIMLPSIFSLRVDSASLLTFEAAQKYKGVIGAEVSRISILQDDGTVLETNIDGAKSGISEWKGIKLLSSGFSFTAGLKQDGTVVVSEGYPYDMPEKTAEWNEIKALSANESNLMGLRNDGTVYTAGDGGWDTSDWGDIVAVSAGQFHYAGLKRSGTVVAKGQYSSSFAESANWMDIIDITVGNNFTAGLKKDGTVVATGSLNEEVNGWNNIVAMASGDYHLVGLKSDGTVVGAGWSSDGQVEVQDWKNIVAITANEFFTVGLKSDGTIVTTGNIYGVQKNISNWSDITTISAGDKNIVGLKKDGNVVAKGGNGNGQNWVSDWSNITQISAGKLHTLGLRQDGTVVHAGNTGMGEHRVTGWTNIKQVSAGDGFSVGLRMDGTVVATGYNGSDETKVGSWTDIVKVYAGSNYTLGIKEDGTVLRTPGTTPFWSNIKDAAIGNGFTVGLKKDGTVVAIGNNEDGQINLNDWRNITAIAVGWGHTVGLRSNGTVVATGLNSYGQTNVQDWTDIVAVAAGTDSTFGLKSDGTVVTTSWTRQASSAAVKVDKLVAKPGDTVNISLENSRFYTPESESNEYSLNGSVAFNGHLAKQVNGEFKDSYLVKENDVGRVGISLPGTTDFFGNPLEKKDLFQVVPLQSIISSKSEAKSGEKVTLTATFYQPVNPDFKLSLDGAVKLDGIQMTQLAGSDGKKFFYQYTVPDNYNIGDVNATLENISLAEGNQFDPYTEHGVFKKRNISPPVMSLTVSQEKAKLWDSVTVTAKFSEKVRSGVKLSLEGGAVLNNAFMTEVEGSDGMEFTYQYFVSPGNLGPVNAKLMDVYDAAGNFYDVYTQANLFITDGINPDIAKLEVSQKKAKLGDKVLITATFTELLKADPKITLSGGMENKDFDMTQVSGSNGLQYQYEYTVGDKDTGVIQASVHGFEDEFGNHNTYWVDNLFYADGKLPSVSIQSEEELYRQGDYAHVIAEFSEPVKPGVKIKFSGAIQGEEYVMTEVPDSQGNKYEVYYEIKEGQYRYVNVELTNIEDMAGNVTSSLSPKLFYISDPTNANLAELSIDGFELSPEFSPEVTEYEAVVPISAGTVTIEANAEDYEDSVVNGLGNVPLGLGDNVHVITVTSKNGTVKDYRLTIKAVDMEKPVFEGIKDMTIKAGSSFNSMEGITAVDGSDGDLTGEVKVTGIVYSSKPGEYTLDYTVTDKAGNSATATRKITVIDTEKPDISGTEGTFVNVNAVFNPKAGVKAEDNVDGDLTPSMVIEGSVNTKVAGTYTLSYTVTDSSGNETRVIRKVTVVLAVPTNVQAASASYNSVKVSWAAISGANGYAVYKATSSTGQYSYVGSTTSTSYTNSGLTTNNTYYYKIKAYQANGSAKTYSNESLAVSARPVPAVPGSVKAASASYNSVRVSWASISGANGYAVYRATSNTGTYSYVGSTTSTSYTNSGLSTNKSYYYKVKAYRLVGSTKVYGSISAAATAKPIPSTPGSVKAASASYNSIKTSWKSVSGGSGYAVYRATSSTGTYSYVGSTTSTNFSNTGLTTNKTYYYKVRAYRLVGSSKVYGNYSGAVSAKPIPSVPANLKASRYSSSSIKLAWSKVSGATGYQVYRATTKTGTYGYVRGTTSSSYIDTGLTKKKTYYYKIRAYRMVGKTKVYSGWTKIVSAYPY